MTFSIVACSPDRQSLGVAVASKFLAVGAAVPGARAGAGAIATQALANLRYLPDGLALLEAGVDATEVVRRLVGEDPHRADRQVGVVDALGRSATYTGSDCMDFAGGRCGPGYAVQGNILAGPQVLDGMVATWLAGAATPSATGLPPQTSGDAPLARRLHAALAAGDAAGGDRRGRQSAALLVVRPGGGYGGGSDTVVDLRVDDHPDPVTELGRLLDLHHLLFDRTPDSDCLPLTGRVAADLRTALDRLGFDDPDLERALGAAAGVENLEERLRPGLLDPVVLTHLQHLAEAAD